MKQSNRGGFNSSFGLMMAVAGSAVGLGNIWRFPFLAGEHGGAAFIIIYIAMIFLVGLPILLSEFTMGKSSKRGAVSSFSKLVSDEGCGVKSSVSKSLWGKAGYIGFITGFVLMGVYLVISGWTLNLLFDSIMSGGESRSVAQITEDFTAFTSTGWQPALYSVGFVIICAMIVGSGVEKGVERWSKFLMPSLVIFVLFLCGYSTTLSGWDKAVEFLFQPDWSKVTTKTLLDALGQVFYTLTVGMGVLITYSSYSQKKDNLFRSKLTVTLIDTSVAVLAGLMIFPAVFTFEGLAPTQGPDLVFITMPNIFGQLSFGWGFSILFSAVLIIAALTSAISIFEMLTTVFIEQFRMTRKRAVTALAVLLAISAFCCAYWDEVFNLFDYITSNILMVLSALCVSLFTGYVMNRRVLRATFTNDGENSTKIYRVYLFLIRYVAPVAITMILLSQLGFI